MFLKLVAVILATTALSAQRGGGGIAGIRETALPEIGRPMTLGEQFNDRLDLDVKTQVPAVQEILVAASKEAGPLGAELMKLRQALVNAELNNKPDDAKQLLDAYTAAETKMAALEASTFTKVLAVLKPNQKSKAPEAFAVMAGIFLPSAPAGNRGGGRPGGGGARGGGR